MRDRLTRRLDELKSEFGRGQEQLARLEGEISQLRQSLLRISGAIQVLEEELAADAAPKAQEPGDG